MFIKAFEIAKDQKLPRGLNQCSDSYVFNFKKNLAVFYVLILGDNLYIESESQGVTGYMGEVHWALWLILALHSEVLVEGLGCFWFSCIISLALTVIFLDVETIYIYGCLHINLLVGIVE